MANRGREVRTSASHPIQVNWLPEDVATRVGLTFAPGKKGPSLYGYHWDRDLHADLEVLAREQRIDALVTLMELNELAHSHIANLFEAANQHGLATIHFPIPDLGVPQERRAVDTLLDQIEARLANGERVAIHCLGGIGRTGTIATCLLVRRGMPLADAIRIVQQTRCAGFPESGPQREFVTEYARRIAQRPPAAAMATKAAPLVSIGATSSSPMPWALFAASDRAHLDAGSTLSRDQVDDLLSATERQVQASPAACFALAPDGTATLHTNQRSYHAGRFEVPTLATLRERAKARTGERSGHVRLSILRGQHPLTDIGTLQATAPAGTLFQVASQFNCLEAPSRHIVPITKYLSDPTQGPRASVSAFPGTFLRHYCAPRPNGERFVQTDNDCINLLDDAFTPDIARVKSGYLLTDQITDVSALARSLEHRFDQLRVGLHDDIEVVLGHDWGGPVPSAPHQRIAQVFTSTIALGMYSSDDGSPALATVRRQLLRAAYLGTLLGAVTLGKRSVMLTLIGGGVFSNPHRDIWNAIHWAAAQAEPYFDGVLDVIVNVRTDRVDPKDLDAAFARGGVCLEIEKGAMTVRGA